ncbi:F-box/LRR-repeat protein 18 [Triplophysa dalaica]|uniref:F-box/LRR-repeat protein 18 n=1 Tax=Triplophysa dalaica TaxID=1582913 RepID=UPI0024DFE19C|nr:F-box/LRR-repeat protein 18 [Triplophysa dalaica]
MDDQIIACCPDSISQTSVSISDFSDEILLNILIFIPSHDLMLNVNRVCRKFRILCLDRSLRAHIHLHKNYTANDDAVKQVLKNVSSHIQTLDLCGCYWLAGSTVDQVTRCKGLVSLDLSGCRLTSVRLSHLLSALQSLRSLALDVGPGFDLHQVSTEGKAALSRLQELKQTLLTPSYGVVPCCSALRILRLYLEASEGWREAGGCAQLMVGQSSVPHYQNLCWFSARLAPGEVNRTLLALYLAVFSMRVPEGLTGLVLSVPGPAPPRPVAMTALMESMVGNTVSTLQLPRTWLDGAILGRVIAHGCPAYLNVSRCSSPGFNPLHVMLSAGRDLSPLQSLNLRGCGRGPIPESCGKVGEEMDAESVKALTECCPHLVHLNLSATHYHHTVQAGQDGHLCGKLGRLAALRSLALPVCALAQSPPAPVNTPDSNTNLSSGSLLLGLKKSNRIGVPTYRPRTEDTGGACRDQQQDRTLCIQPLLQGCPHLVELELIGAGFSSALPRNEPAMRKDPAACPWSHSVGDGELAALGGLKFLRKLTLAHLPGVLKGTGLIELVQGCRDLQSLSLAHLGSLKMMNYTQALLETLTYCTQLRDLRLEQPYFNGSAAFFEALSKCQQLRRLCLVSRQGTFHPSAVTAFMQSCVDVIMCHMFMNGTLVTCKMLQKTLLDSLSSSRPALSVVIYPLLHEDLENVIRGMPLCHLDEITLFKSRVAEEPMKL